MTAPIAILTIDARHLPLSQAKRALLASRLDALAGCFQAIGWEWLDTATTTLGCEYGKGEHRDALCVHIMPDGATP